MEPMDNAIRAFMRLHTLLHNYQMQHLQLAAPGKISGQGQGRVLAALKAKPETTQKELTELLGMSKQGLAILLKKLERDGYITRQTSPVDRRISQIRLTEKGSRESEEMDREDVPDEMLAMFACLDEGELDNALDYFERMCRHLEDLFENREIDFRRLQVEAFKERHRPKPHDRN